MYLYNSYCYPDIYSAADSFYSSAVVNGLGLMQSYTVNADTVAITFLSVNSINSKSFLFTVNYTFKQCDMLGFDNSFFGLSNIDIINISWQVALCMSIAWGFTQLRKMFK